MPYSPIEQDLWTAVLTDDGPAAERALAAGASPNRRRGTKSMLARALELPTSEMARRLLEAGASPLSAAHGTTALALALQRGFGDLLPLFHRAGVDLTQPVEPHGLTPAGLAARALNLDVLRELQRLNVPIGVANLRSDAIQPGQGHSLRAWCCVINRKNPPDAAWWEGVDLLIQQSATDDERAAMASVVQTSEAAITGHGKALLARLLGTHWASPAFFQTLHITLIHSRMEEWADELLAQHSIPVRCPNGAKASPWLCTALAAQLFVAITETGKPRRLKQAAGRVRRLLNCGADPQGQQGGWPLLFWGLKKGVPWEALEPLLDAGADVSQRLTLVDPAPTLTEITQGSELWEGSSLAHFAAWHNACKALAAVVDRAPALLEVRDAHGLTPLLRALVPPVFSLFPKTERVLWPTLNTFRALGADPMAVSGSFGNGVAHLLAVATEHNLYPADTAAVLLGMREWAPQWLDQRNGQGRTGWEALAGSAHFAHDPTFLALQEQRRLDSTFLPASGATRPRSMRL